MAKRRSSRRGSRRRGRSRRRSGGSGFVLKELLVTGGIAAAAGVGIPMLMDKVLPAEIKSKIQNNPYLTGGAIAAAGVVGGMLLKKFMPKFARPVALGGIVAGGTVALTPLIAQATGHAGLGRLGGRGLGILPSLPYDRPGLPMNGLQGRGLGDSYADSNQYARV